MSIEDTAKAALVPDWEDIGLFLQCMSVAAPDNMSVLTIVFSKVLGVYVMFCFEYSAVENNGNPVWSLRGVVNP